MATAPTYPAAAGPSKVAKRIADSDTTAIVDVVDNSGGSVALKIESMVIATDNTAARYVKFYAHDGSISHLIGYRNVASLAGSDGSTPRVNVLSALGVPGADGVPVIWVPAGTKLQASMDATLASGKYLYITGRAIPYT